MPDIHSNYSDLIISNNNFEMQTHFGSIYDWSLKNGRDIAEKVYIYLKSIMKDTNISENKNFTNFYNPTRPPISLNEYVLRLIIQTRCLISPVCVISAILYVEKAMNKYGIELNEFNIYRLFSTALLISYKTNEDGPHLKNSAYSKIAGLSLYEMNKLERDFLQYLEYDLSLTKEEEIQAQLITSIIMTK